MAPVSALIAITAAATPPGGPGRGRIVYGVIFASLAIAMAVEAYAYYRTEAAQLKTVTATELDAIASLKANQLNDWRAARLADGVIHSRNAAIVPSISRFIEGHADRDTTRRLQEWIDSFVSVGLYDRAFLFDAHGVSRLAAPAAGGPPAAAISLAATEAFGTARVSLVDFYLDGPSQDVRMAIVIPYRNMSGNSPAGVLALRIDPRSFMRLVVETWPRTSETAEALLVRRDGSDALVLTSLRFAPQAAMRTRIPLANPEVLYVKAVLGQTGFVEGLDYRGIRTVGVIHKIPDSPWSLVAHVDPNESAGILRAKLVGVVGLTGMLLFGLGTLLALGWRRQGRQFERQQAALTRTVRESEERLRLALGAAGQGLWDLNVRTGETVVSPEYATMLGYDPAEFHETYDTWRERLHPDERDAVAAQYQQYAAGLLPVNKVEFRLRTKDGGWKWILSQGQVVSRTDDGQPLRMVGTHVDITTRKLAEIRAERLAQLYAALSRCNEAIVHSRNEAELFPKICAAAVAPGGLAMAWIGLVDSESHLVVPVAFDGRGSEYLAGIRVTVDAGDPHGGGPTGTCIRENRPIWCEDFAHDPRTEPWHERGRRFGWAASAALPLVRGGRVVGALTVYAFSAELFDHEGRMLLLEAAADISFALDAFDRESQRLATEAELAESEVRYRTIFSDSTVPRLVIDQEDMRIVDANRAAGAFYGYSVDALTQMKISDINTLDPVKIRQAMDRVVRGEQTRFDFVHQLANGERRNVEVYSTGITVHNRPLLLSAVFDVTDRIRTEQALRETSERFRAIFDEAPLGVALIESLTGRIREVNARFAAIAGRTREELTTIDWMSITHPDDVAEDLSNMAQLNAGRISGFNMNKRYRRPDGSYVWINMTIAALIGEPGGVRQHVCMIEDITERKQAEYEIGRLALMVDAAPSSVTVHDDDGRILYANRRAIEAHGYSREEFLRLNMQALYPPADRHLVAERIAELRGRREVAFEVDHIRKDGSRLPLEVAATVIKWDGGEQFLSIGTDITERKHASDALRESLQEKEALLKEVHHRVKNNLQLITSMLRLEMGRTVHPLVETALSEMQNRVLSMALLHETLYRSGRFAQVDLAAYLGELGHRIFQSLAQAATVTLHTELTPTTVELDQAIPCGLLVNELITNALKHGFPDGRAGAVRLVLRPMTEGQGACIEVSDNGVGLPTDFDARRKDSLGLQLVMDLTRQLRGSLDIGGGPGAHFRVAFMPRVAAASRGDGKPS